MSTGSPGAGRRETGGGDGSAPSSARVHAGTASVCQQAEEAKAWGRAGRPLACKDKDDRGPHTNRETGDKLGRRETTCPGPSRFILEGTGGRAPGGDAPQLCSVTGGLRGRAPPLCDGRRGPGPRSTSAGRHYLHSLASRTPPAPRVLHSAHVRQPLQEPRPGLTSRAASRLPPSLTFVICYIEGHAPLLREAQSAPSSGASEEPPVGAREPARGLRCAARVPHRTPSSQVSHTGCPQGQAAGDTTSQRLQVLFTEKAPVRRFLIGRTPRVVICGERGRTLDLHDP